MRTFYLFLLATVLFLTSCTKNESRLFISVNGDLGEFSFDDPATKATTVSTIRLRWEGGENVYAFAGKQYLGVLNVTQASKGSGRGTITGNIMAPTVTVTKLTLIFASNFDASGLVVGDMYDTVVVPFDDQSSDTPICSVYGYIPYSSGVESITDVAFEFAFASTMVRVNCYNLEPSAAINAATVSNITTECQFSLSDSGVDVTQSSATGMIIVTGGLSAASIQGESTFYLSVPMCTKATSRTLTVYQAGYIGADDTFAAVALKIDRSYNTMCDLDSKPAYSGGIDKYYPITWTW